MRSGTTQASIRQLAQGQRNQPNRASAGLQNSIVTYQRARADALKWTPASCKEKRRAQISEINRVAISSGASLKVRGASGVLDEVDEARRVVEHVADELSSMGIEVMIFHDDTSKTQSENLETIVAFHNEQERDLDVSVHFNAYIETTAPMGPNAFI